MRYKVKTVASVTGAGTLQAHLEILEKSNEHYFVTDDGITSIVPFKRGYTITVLEPMVEEKEEKEPEHEIMGKLREELSKATGVPTAMLGAEPEQATRLTSGVDDNVVGYIAGARAHALMSIKSNSYLWDSLRKYAQDEYQKDCENSDDDTQYSESWLASNDALIYYIGDYASNLLRQLNGEQKTHAQIEADLSTNLIAAENALRVIKADKNLMDVLVAYMNSDGESDDKEPTDSAIWDALPRFCMELAFAENRNRNLIKSMEETCEDPLNQLFTTFKNTPHLLNAFSEYLKSQKGFNGDEENGIVAFETSDMRYVGDFVSYLIYELDGYSETDAQVMSEGDKLLLPAAYDALDTLKNNSGFLRYIMEAELQAGKNPMLPTDPAYDATLLRKLPEVSARLVADSIIYKYADGKVEDTDNNSEGLSPSDIKSAKPFYRLYKAMIDGINDDPVLSHDIKEFITLKNNEMKEKFPELAIDDKSDLYSNYSILASIPAYLRFLTNYKNYLVNRINGKTDEDTKEEESEKDDTYYNIRVEFGEVPRDIRVSLVTTRTGDYDDFANLILALFSHIVEMYQHNPSYLDELNGICSFMVSDESIYKDVLHRLKTSGVNMPVNKSVAEAAQDPTVRATILANFPVLMTSFYRFKTPRVVYSSGFDIDVGLANYSRTLVDRIIANEYLNGYVSRYLEEHGDENPGYPGELTSSCIHVIMKALPSILDQMSTDVLDSRANRSKAASYTQFIDNLVECENLYRSLRDYVIQRYGVGETPAMKDVVPYLPEYTSELHLLARKIVEVVEIAVPLMCSTMLDTPAETEHTDEPKSETHNTETTEQSDQTDKPCTVRLISPAELDKIFDELKKRYGF